MAFRLSNRAGAWNNKGKLYVAIDRKSWGTSPEEYAEARVAEMQNIAEPLRM